MLESYLNTSFCESKFFSNNIEILKFKIKSKAVRLMREGTLGVVLVRAASPLMGAGTLLGSLCLRIGSIIEPIIGILADIGAAIFFRSNQPLANIPFRCRHILPNLLNQIGGAAKDIVFIGIGVGVGGMILPLAACDCLSRYEVAWPEKVK